MLSLSRTPLNHSSKSLALVCFRALASTASTQPLKKTALHSLHVESGAKMVGFCGWDMPLQYSDLNAIDSHLHTRKSSSLFDVSHMLQFKLHGKDRIPFIERLVVADVQALEESAATLSVFTNENGGIIDDTIVSKYPDHLYIVSNAGCAEKDLKHLNEQLSHFKSQGKDVSLEVLENRSLLALQGPKSVETLSILTKLDLSSVPFMHGKSTLLKTEGGEVECLVTRCGYTGEDGFEISVPSSHAIALAKTLLKSTNVKWAGLAARDSLRLEAGLCLYGNDLNEDITPVEASLTWLIAERRRKEGGFIGADKILSQLANKTDVKRRIGLTIEGAPARAGYPIFNREGSQIGTVTSGCPAPSLQMKNIAMGYVDKKYFKVGTPIQVQVRKNKFDGIIAKVPFVPHSYFGKK